MRDLDALKAAVDDGVAHLGRLDIVLANAGVASMGGRADKMKVDNWKHTIDINLTGLWNTARAAIPHLLAGGRGGSIVLTSSVGGERAMPNMSHYVSAKHGVIGLMRSLAVRARPARHPGQLRPAHQRQHADVHERRDLPDVPPGPGEPGLDDIRPVARQMHVLPIGWVEPVDVSNAILFLVSDEARYITGVELPVDAGTLLK